MALRLRVATIVRVAIQDVVWARHTIGRLGVLPFGLALLAHFAFVFFLRLQSRDPGSNLLIGAATALPHVLFAVPFYRYLLAQQESETVLRWDTAHSALLGWSVAKSAAWAGADLFFEKSAAVFVGPILAYVFARFCLVIPAVAEGEYPDLQLAWIRSRGNGWRLVSIRALVYLFASVPTIAVAWLMVQGGHGWLEALGASSFIGLTVVEVVGATTLALCFQSLRTPDTATHLAFAADEEDESEEEIMFDEDRDD